MEENTELKKISVVIPMYNAKDTIVRALNSVISQTYQGVLEIIVVNDGSKDNSPQIVEDFISKNPQINLKLINQLNGGVSKARNTGLRNATGEYIALLDSDDAWFENKLTAQMNILIANGSIDFLGASFEGFGFKNKEEGALVKIEFKDLIFKNYFQPSTIVFKSEIVKSIGFFDENQRYAEEGNYFLRIARQFNCYFLNKNLIVYGDGKSGFGESGLSANLKEMEKGELKNLKFVCKQGWITFPTYFTAVTYSILKYIRRVLIVKFK